jgi:hypothetical protein
MGFRYAAHVPHVAWSYHRLFLFLLYEQREQSANHTNRKQLGMHCCGTITEATNRNPSSYVERGGYSSSPCNTVVTGSRVPKVTEFDASQPSKTLVRVLFARPSCHRAARELRFSSLPRFILGRISRSMHRLGSAARSSCRLPISSPLRCDHE